MYVYMLYIYTYIYIYHNLFSTVVLRAILSESIKAFIKGNIIFLWVFVSSKPTEHFNMSVPILITLLETTQWNYDIFCLCGANSVCCHVQYFAFLA